MCQQCWDAVKKYWPDLPESDYHDLLWNTTAFPFADPETTRKQVQDMAERSGQNLHAAFTLAVEDLDRDMAVIRKGQVNGSH